MADGPCDPVRGGHGKMSAAGLALRTAIQVVASAACYYLATRLAWMLCFPDSKVSLFFPPHAILVAILLLVPVGHWWAYVLTAVGSHFIATQQAGWPPRHIAAPIRSWRPSGPP